MVKLHAKYVARQEKLEAFSQLTRDAKEKLEKANHAAPGPVECVSKSPRGLAISMLEEQQNLLTIESVADGAACWA